MREMKELRREPASMPLRLRKAVYPWGKESTRGGVYICGGWVWEDCGG